MRSTPHQTTRRTTEPEDEVGGIAPAVSSSTSRRMSRQASRDTGPELALRRTLFAQGFRYRVEYPVPGLPRRRIDIAFTRARLAVFVDGCFWHACPQHATEPANNATWWARKLRRNVDRDRETDAHLRAIGWRVIRVWEHEVPADAAARIIEALRNRL